ncbi:HU family DNA-binding protein [Myxococcota bacterium]|nr:HU family DNA-binding protein [Myxococcota bacterium]MBU1431890.1 HU family DNA-binding protein [Myxococcota bacterium]MBU1896958.1 HU family DNA-binding protein [Myxococcota bacterium]
MSKKDLIAAVHRNFSGKLTKKQIGEILNATFNAIAENLKEDGDRYAHPGFGTFQVKVRPARSGRNPQSGKKIKIPAMKVASFKIAPELKKKIN